MMTEQQADLARWAAEAVRALHTGLARATEVHRLLGAGMDPATVAEAVAQAIDCATSGLDHLRAIQRHAGGAGPCHCRVCGDRGTFEDHACTCAKGEPYRCPGVAVGG